MASELLLLPLLCSLSPLAFTAVAQGNNGTVPVGSSLSTGSDPWLSPSADFAFGFQRIDGNGGGFLLAIWYNKLPDRTIVWYANRDGLAPAGSKAELTPSSGLVLRDPRGGQLWAAELSASGAADHGFINDTGNFVIRTRDSDLLWESFGVPTDTMLPTQTLESGGAVLHSRRRETNFTKGRFQFRLLADGNLVLNGVNQETYWPYGAYYISGTYDRDNVSNSGFRLIFNATGYMYIVRRNGGITSLTPGTVNPVSDYYHRATLNFDGVFSQYYHLKKFAGGGAGWKAVWTKPDDICGNIAGVPGSVNCGDNDIGSGVCGFNNICSLREDQRPICECPRGFPLLDQNDAYGDCTAAFVQDCGREDLSSPAELYDFTELPNTDWPTSNYEQLEPSNEEDCRKSCLHDCKCGVAIFGEGSCWKKRLPLSNGKKGGGVNRKALIKVRKDGSSPLSQYAHGFLPGEGCKTEHKRILIIVGSVIMGASLLVNFAGCFSAIRRRILPAKNPVAGNRVVDANLPCFSYGELVETTDGFKEELGRGAFGTVYKGHLKQGAAGSVPVAVKKLDRPAADTEKEFKAEVTAIAKTHHKNLVRLLGFCDQGPHRLLVYEFMSNGTLASFLFGEIRPSWNLRTQLAIGIARGLLYLHEECSVPIIHCDVKPQNVLLDEHHTARISDFGLAKLMMMNQSQTHTAIRGTKGYVAPDWFRNTHITPKVDVYSFGVLLLEIVCCHRVSDTVIDGVPDAELTDWAYRCYREGRLEALIGGDAEAMNEVGTVERFVKAAVWCIQEEPSHRPTMRAVGQMLEGVVGVARPPCPYPTSSLR